MSAMLKKAELKLYLPQKNLSYRGSVLREKTNKTYL